ncbi:hypothetical protein LDO26_13105 [Luteimonas sp. BDR2-5]|uniref:hypothetical protein n=1 Tax=Proluteimonas luteida TaxID=2878685 RepID=UPI001E33DC7A|nr:hypothetical protein [Luteimonas sp. BDR2-5]MCD9029137.1 hypothetical protein [Luteimonas sp. BDR2-5]
MSISSNYTISSFNSYSARGGDDALDRIGDLADVSDIIGFQETGDPGRHRDAGARVAGEMIAHGRNGYMGPQNGNPIFWDAERFDLLHAETRIDESFGRKDETRATNLVVLRDNDTGAALLVSNLHAETTNEGGYRTRQFTDLEARADAIMDDFAIAARIDIGDHNQGLPSELYGDHGHDTVAGAGQDARDQGMGGIDHIASRGTGHRTELVENRVAAPAPNGDGYRHQMLSSTIAVTSDADGNARNLDADLHGDNGKGAVAYRDAGYNGTAWALGFGNGGFGTGVDDSGVRHGDINDSVSSVRVSDGAALELRQNADGSGRALTLDASTSNVGKNMNDRASSFLLYY